MIRFCNGNLLEADADAMVNTVNCVGIMGKGIALQFKQAFPDNYKSYAKACARQEVELGRMFVFLTGKISTPSFIINFPTKNHWKGKSKLSDIKSGLVDLIDVVRRNRIKSIALPPLGCGNGGLDWSSVFPLIEAAFATVPEVSLLLFAPQAAPASADMPVATKRPRMTRSRAIMVKLIDRYREPGYRLTKIEVQKLAYFIQKAGEPLNLNFVKHTFGPYSDSLKHTFNDMEGHMTRGFGDGSTESTIYPCRERSRKLTCICRMILKLRIDCKR